MSGWNYADVYEQIASAVPDAPCQVQGDRIVTWSEFDRRANAVAASLLEAGLGHQAKVAVYLRNCPEFLEAYVGCFKAGMVPVNINFRYGPDEILHVFTNGDVEAVVFHASYADTLERCRDELPLLSRFWAVGDGHELPGWAESYDAAAAADRDRVAPPWGRSGDDAILVYTGGTTGLPKGVLWRQDDVFRALGCGGNFYLERPPVSDLDELVARLDRSDSRLLVACPLMHATGLFTSLSLMNEGWAIETLTIDRFSAPAVWRVIAAHCVSAIVIVGDAFARPMLAELAAGATEYDLHRLILMISAGAVWTKEVRAGLVRHLPWITLCDNYGSSEALRGVQTYSRDGEIPETGVIAQSERLQMLDDDGRLVHDMSPGVSGALVISGHLAVGYYKDPERSARTWREIDGQRRCITGDFGLVEHDRTIRLLGRGTSVVNTGGEKVYPPEVEEVLRKHETVNDAAVIGVPDERFGQAVTALVVPADGCEVEFSVLSQHVKRHLAGFKAPRHLLVVGSIPRTVTGKIDYAACASLASQHLEWVTPGDAPVVSATAAGTQ